MKDAKQQYHHSHSSTSVACCRCHSIVSYNRLHAHPSIWKSSIWAANFVGNSVASNRLMFLTPLLPDNSLQWKQALFNKCTMRCSDAALHAQAAQEWQYSRVIESVHIIAKTRCNTHASDDNSFIVWSVRSDYASGCTDRKSSQ